MYTLKKVMEMLNVGTDIYCVLYRTDRYIGEGWLLDLEPDPNTKIESYRLASDDEGEYLVLHLV